MKSEAGFTLMELLVVVAIIGILAAIAIPQFNAYRVRAFDGRSVSDLHNAAIGEEAYFAATERYIDCIGATACSSIFVSFSGSPGVNLAMYQVPEAGTVPEHFTGRSFHPQGSKQNLATAFMWNSNQGGLQ